MENFSNLQQLDEVLFEEEQMLWAIKESQSQMKNNQEREESNLDDRKFFRELKHESVISERNYKPKTFKSLINPSYLSNDFQYADKKVYNDEYSNQNLSDT